MNHTNKGGTMKKFAFVTLGLLSALATFITATWGVKGNWIGWPVAAAFAYGTYRAFRKAARVRTAPRAPRTPTPERRPWER